MPIDLEYQEQDCIGTHTACQSCVNGRYWYLYCGLTKMGRKNFFKNIAS